MPKQSEATKVVLNIIEQVKKSRELADKHPGIPLMQQEVSRAQAAAQLRRMTPEERTRFLAEKGQDAVLAMLPGRVGSDEP